MPQAIDQKIKAALYQRVGVMSAAISLTAIEFDKYEKPPTGAGGVLLPHVVYLLIPNQNQRPFIRSKDSQFRQGIFQLDLYTPLNTSGIEASGLVGQIKHYFQTDLPLYSGGVKVSIQRDPDVAGDIIAKPYRRTPISVRFESFI